MPEEKKEKPKEEESEDNDYVEIQCDAIGATVNHETKILIFRIFKEPPEKDAKQSEEKTEQPEEETGKIYYCAYSKDELTPKRRKGLKAMRDVIDGFLWESDENSEDNEGVSMFG